MCVCVHARECVSVCLCPANNCELDFGLLVYLDTSKVRFEGQGHRSTFTVTQCYLPPDRGDIPAIATSSTMSPGPRPTSVPSGIVIHPTAWSHYTNVRDRQDNGPIAQGEPLLVLDTDTNIY